MKNLLSLLVLLVAVATIATAQKSKKVDGPKMSVETKVLDLGNVVQQTAPLDGKFVFRKPIEEELDSLIA